MTSSSRRLIACIDEWNVGEVREKDGLWSFQYSSSWLAYPQRFALSPQLPLRGEPVHDGASVRPVQWYFDNLLPEEGQRILLASHARRDAADAFGPLAAYGDESAGSLTLLSPGERAGAGGLRPLPELALSRRIRPLPAHGCSAGWCSMY